MGRGWGGRGKGREEGRMGQVYHPYLRFPAPNPDSVALVSTNPHSCALPCPILLPLSPTTSLTPPVALPQTPSHFLPRLSPLRSFTDAYRPQMNQLARDKRSIEKRSYYKYSDIFGRGWCCIIFFGLEMTCKRKRARGEEIED